MGTPDMPPPRAHSVTARRCCAVAPDVPLLCTACCPRCRIEFRLPREAVAAIIELATARARRLESGRIFDAPTMYEPPRSSRPLTRDDFPAAVLEDPRLQHACPCCGACLRFDPFFAGVPVSGYAPPAADLQARLATLTSREREVARLLLLNRSAGDIACELRMSLLTVETYRARLMQKLGARSRVELRDLLAAADDL